jgi:hypothetical protein
MTQQRLLLAALLTFVCATSAAAAARCRPGLIGAGCNTCVSDAACVAMTKVDTAWCFNTTAFMPETKKKSYACDTVGTPFQNSITHVWVDCAGTVWDLIGCMMLPCSLHQVIFAFPKPCDLFFKICLSAVEVNMCTFHFAMRWAAWAVEAAQRLEQQLHHL